jgi:predicted alpha/beta superfamily hydrolase
VTFPQERGWGEAFYSLFLSMLKTLLAIITLFTLSSVMAQQTIRIEIKQLPVYHPAGSDIYMAGSFNGWNPSDDKYKFQHTTNGKYFIELKLDAGTYEFKITRGGWDKVECKKSGAGVENRVLKVDSRESLVVSQLVDVEEWQDRFPVKPRTSTASKNVHIIDTSFWIPQLKRTRRVWIYLPENYASTKNRYPVLYMQDGQNVFDDATSFSGEWGIDEMLDSMPGQQCIVVAIDHGANKRLNEYNPYNSDRFGKGEGNAYLDFVVKTLKPFIDKKYRTLKDKKHTSIAGSSMGGLISMYALLKYPTVFGGAGVFSPAFWVTGTKIYEDIKKKGKKVNAHIYFYAGKQEGETMVPDMLKAFETMSTVSKSKMTTVIRDEGKHNEATWRKEFIGGYSWIVDNR